jgi:hypothetical protein
MPPFLKLYCVRHVWAEFSGTTNFAVADGNGVGIMNDTLSPPTYLQLRPEVKRMTSTQKHLNNLFCNISSNRRPSGRLLLPRYGSSMFL